jgi:hypothetical protein
MKFNIDNIVPLIIDNTTISGTEPTPEPAHSDGAGAGQKRYAAPALTPYGQHI